MTITDWNTVRKLQKKRRQRNGLHSLAILFGTPCWSQVSNEVACDTAKVVVWSEMMLWWLGCNQWLFGLLSMVTDQSDPSHHWHHIHKAFSSTRNHFFLKKPFSVNPRDGNATEENPKQQCHI